MNRFATFFVFYYTLVTTISFKLVRTNLKTNRDQHHKLHVSNLAPIVSNDLLTLQDFMTTNSPPANYDDIQAISILLAATGYVIYDNRPRGSANQELVEVKRSTIKAGQCLYSRDC